jgi:ADP-heptose:LPS heptosyltransferase
MLLTTPTANKKMADRAVSDAVIFADHIVDSTKIIPADKLRSLKYLNNIKKEIIKFNPDVTIIMPFSGEVFLSRLKKLIYLRIVGVNRNVYGIRMNNSVGFLKKDQYIENLYQHQIISALKTLEEISIKTEEVVFNIQIPESEKQLVDKIWSKNNLNNSFVIAIHTGSKQKVKMWPLENMLTLCYRILKRNPLYEIVIIGGKEDSVNGEWLVGKLGNRSLNLCGKTTLMQTSDILRRCKLFIGNDSGPMHLASAVGTPVIAIFSSIVFPVFWKPWSSKSVTIRNPVKCEFCFTDSDNCPRGTYECINGISVDEVTEQCFRIICNL